MTTNQTEWVEDVALGVAVREVGGELQARAVTCDGAHRLDDAIQAAYGDEDYPESYRISPDAPHHWIIDPAHRLAFARALSPIAAPTVHCVEIGGAA